jgi:hypothetical protein
VTVPDVSDLPPFLRESLDRCIALGRRFYVAWRPDFPRALLRHKDAASLAEWQSRDWAMFDHQVPTISDVTAALPGMWRVLLYAAGPRERIVFQPPETLTLLSGPVVPGESFDLITDANSFEEFAGMLGEPEQKFWSKARAAFETMHQAYKRTTTRPGVYCQRCDFRAEPYDAVVGGDLSRPETLEACGAHLVALGHGDGGWLEVQKGQTQRFLRLPWPEGEVRPWAVSSPGQPA